MSFRDISKIIKSYDKRIRLEERKKDSAKNKNDNKQIKRISKNIRAYKLLSMGKTPVDVAVELDLCFEETRKYWTEFLRLKNMKKLYNIFIENEFHLDYLFKIDYFLLRNNISMKDMENILQGIYDINELYQTHSNLNVEIEELKQIKNNYLLNLNTNRQQLLPLGLPKYCYEQL